MSADDEKRERNVSVSGGADRGALKLRLTGRRAVPCGREGRGASGGTVGAADTIHERSERVTMQDWAADEGSDGRLTLGTLTPFPLLLLQRGS